MTWLTLAPVVTKWARRTWPLWAVVAAFALSAWSIQRYGQRRYAAGKADAQRGVVFDSVLASRVRARVETLTVATDSAVAKAKRSARAVRAVVDSMPPSVKALPEVAPLVTECTALAARTDSAFTALDLEREGRRMQQLVHDRDMTAARVVIAAQADTIQALKKRPTWKKAAVLSAVGVGVGAVAREVVPVILKGMGAK